MDRNKQKPKMTTKDKSNADFGEGKGRKAENCNSGSGTYPPRRQHKRNQDKTDGEHDYRGKGRRPRRPEDDVPECHRRIRYKSGDTVGDDSKNSHMISRPIFGNKPCQEPRSGNGKPYNGGGDLRSNDDQHSQSGVSSVYESPPVTTRRQPPTSLTSSSTGWTPQRLDSYASSSKPLSSSNSGTKLRAQTYLSEENLAGRYHRDLARAKPGRRWNFFQPLKDDMPSNPVEIQKRFTNLEKDLKTWSHLKDDFTIPSKTVENWSQIVKHLKDYIRAAEIIFNKDTTMYIENEMDVRVWKYGIYSLSSFLRRAIKSSSSKESISAAKQASRDLCNMGSNHFNFLISSAKSALKLNMKEVLLCRGILRNGSCTTAASKEELLIYRLFISLGDVHRYAYEFFAANRDFKLSRDMYRFAVLCDTTKSRAYYQLAIMAKASRDMLGMVFYYLRAYDGNPKIDGINTQLVYMFDDIYHKFVFVKQQYWLAQMRKAERTIPHEYRIQPKHERWVFMSKGNYIPSAFNVPLGKVEHLKSLEVSEIENLFSTAIAYFIGLVYTNIGTEQIEIVSKDIIVYFEGMLVKNCLKIGIAMKTFGLLLYMTDYLNGIAEGDKEAGRKQQARHMRDACLKTTYNLLILVCEKLIRSVKLLDWDNPMMNTLSAILHVWCRWTKRRSYISHDLVQFHKNYKGSPSKHKEVVGDKLHHLMFLNSLARVYADLYILLERHQPYIFPEISKGQTKTCVQNFRTLPEQLLLDGFGEVLLSKDCDLSEFFHSGKYSKERAWVHFRFTWMILFVEKLFPGYRRARSKIHQTTDKPVVLPVDEFAEKEFKQIGYIHERLRLPLRSESSKLVYKSKAALWKMGDANNARVIVRNQSKRMRIVDPRFSAHKPPPISKAYEIWMDLVIQQVKVEMVVRPIHLVIDTNVFIDSLPTIKELMSIARNRLIIPSTVLKELRSLAKGATNPDSPKINRRQMNSEERRRRIIHAMEVGEACVKAIQFLDQYKDNFRLVTVTGNEKKMYNYSRQKVWDEHISPTLRNDERIMETCMYLELKMAESRKLDCPIRIFRNVVLLTADRSLRVRGNAQEIPTRDIYSFIDWYRRYLILNKKESTKKPPKIMKILKRGEKL